jgi:predicted kinase
MEDGGDEAGRLIVMCGLPGSGKTTCAKDLEAALGAIRFCPDEWLAAMRIDLWDQTARGRVEQLQWGLAQELLARRLSVIIEWGVWSRAERDVLRRRARELGAAVELHYLEVPLEELWRRVQARNERGEPGVPVIERAHLEEWSARAFEPPTPDELALYDPACLSTRSTP